MADTVGAGGLTRDTLSEFGLPDAARAEATALRRNAVRLAHLLSRQQLEAGRAPGRLVTIRISGFHMDGTLPSRTVILRLATLSSLRLPEVLVWSGGVRLVYTEYVVATAGSPRPVDASPRLTAVNGEREGYVDDAELTSPLAAELRAHHDRAVGFFLALLEQRIGAIQYTLQRQHARNQVPLARRRRRRSDRRARQRGGTRARGWLPRRRRRRRRRRRSSSDGGDTMEDDGVSNIRLWPERPPLLL